MPPDGMPKKYTALPSYKVPLPKGELKQKRVSWLMSSLQNAWERERNQPNNTMRQQTNSERGTFSRTTNTDFSLRSMAGAEKETRRD